MLKFREIGNVLVTELTDEDHIITEVQKMLDLMGDAGADNFIYISHPYL
jgi:hypothetical protein